MPFASWNAFYHSDLQSPTLLILAPLAFLLYLAIAQRAAVRARRDGVRGWLERWALAFALLTVLDPLCTGPLTRALGFDGSWAGRVVAIFFVLLGDFRIFALLFGAEATARENGKLRTALVRAALYTLIVPLSALTFWLAAGRPDEHWLWLAYELAFALLAAWLGLSWATRVAADRPALCAWLRSVSAFAAVYYSLWAGADIAILSGFDAGWGLRVIPNQLYYAFTVPFAYWRFHASGLA